MSDKTPQNIPLQSLSMLGFRLKEGDVVPAALWNAVLNMFITHINELEYVFKGGTEWVFDGGDASNNLNIELVIDKQMSDESDNPVANRVVKQYVDTQIQDSTSEVLNTMSDYNANIKDYFTDTGTDGIWTYEKRASGIAECWAVIHTTISDLVRWDEYHYYRAIADYEFPKINGKPLFVDVPKFDYDVGNNATTGFGRGSIYTLRERQTTTNTGMLYIAGVSKHLDSFEELYVRDDGLRVYKLPADMEITISITAKGFWK